MTNYGYSNNPMSITEPTTATAKQLNFIQILSNDLQLTPMLRDINISEVIKRKFKWFDGNLSINEASLVIGTFRQWKSAKEEDNPNELA